MLRITKVNIHLPLFLAAALCLNLGLARAAEPPSDPLLDLFIQKGYVTQEEAAKVRAEADKLWTNKPAALPPSATKWKISNGIKSIELFGDLRLRYEDRQASTPANEHVDLQRGRMAFRFGLKGNLTEDFYYGFRLDTAPNPRSPWVTFGTSSSGIPYQGPYGKSTFGINVGQLFMGWKNTNWVDITVGKMPLPLYTTPMVWDSDLNPEGAAEKFHHDFDGVTLFANLGQFLYQDVNPAYSSSGLGFGSHGSTGDDVFQIVWQGGAEWHINTNASIKLAGTYYQYMGLRKFNTNNSYPAPDFSGTYIGEGTYLGPGNAPVNGASGYGTSGTSTTYPSFGFPLNQTGLDHLKVLEFPFEANYRLNSVNLRLFGDFAYNLEGRERAEDAARGYSAYLANPASFGVAGTPTIKAFSPQTDDVKAYQVGLGVGTADLAYGPMQGLVYGSGSKKHAWEIRGYWQHVEQYALDPNLLDSDFFEGRGNLEGFYTAAAYGFSENMIATVRYGYASRINSNLGTGGSNQDIPQVNPVYRYNLLQLDLTMRF